MPGKSKDMSILESFHVTSPWSDRHSLIAQWSWSPNADLSYFDNAHIYYYSSLDEGFEKSKQINEPLTFYTITGLRPETVYFVCLRILRRRRPTTLSNIIPTASTFSPVSSTTTKRTLAVQLPWNQRQPLSRVIPDNYAFEVKCNEATTQNWHLSALIGGIVGVILALILGILLLIASKHKHWWQGGGNNLPDKILFNNSYGPKSHSLSRGGYRQSSNSAGSRNNMWGRSSSSRGVSEFSGNLREEDEEDEAIAEDDEDTEADTACKSSVRSQAGIYGGSGGTTSSNRHSSVSSIDPRDDSSSMIHHLPVNGQLGNKRGSRKSRHEFLDMKRTTKGGVVGEQQRPLISDNSMADEYPGVKVNILSPSPETGGTKEDLSAPIEIDRPPTVPRCDDRAKGRHSIFDQSPTFFFDTPHRMSIGTPLLDSEPIYSKPRILKEKYPTLKKLDSFRDQKFSMPLPLIEPQPVSLTHPVLIEKLPSSPTAAIKHFSGVNKNWIKSPRIQNSSSIYQVNEAPYLPENDDLDDENEDRLLQDAVEEESSLHLSTVSMKTDSSYETCLGGCYVDPEQSIYAEFIETI